MKYFGVHGHLVNHPPGLFIIEARSLAEASHKLIAHQQWGWTLTDELREIKDEWARVLESTIECVINREKDYYTDLGNGIFYFEI